MTVRIIVAIICTFAVVETVCRLLLHLSDSVVPLVLFPACGVVAIAVFAVTRRREHQ